MSQDRIDARNEENFAEFREYVQEHKLKVSDTKDVSGWVRGRRHIYLAVYDGMDILYEFGVYANEPVYSQNHAAMDSVYTSVPGEPTYQYILDPSDTMQVAFADGSYTVTIIDFSEEFILRLSKTAASAVVFGTVFVDCTELRGQDIHSYLQACKRGEADRDAGYQCSRYCQRQR